jgi:type I restriction enzyme M protein
MAARPVDEVLRTGIIVPRYYDARWLADFEALSAARGWPAISLGDLADAGFIRVSGGHGSPSNDQRTGHIPYVKVSDIRSLRVNVNPTNLVSEAVARRFWGGATSGLQAWDLITPNRASSNIGEFAVLLPGEEQVVLTKEMFVLRIVGGEDSGWSPFYLLWALSLKAVRRQWQRVALMQTNREDVGKRWREILIPKPTDRAWAREVSSPFRKYFTTIATARTAFRQELEGSGLDFIASAFSIVPEPVEVTEEDAEAAPKEAAPERSTGRRRADRTRESGQNVASEPLLVAPPITAKEPVPATRLGDTERSRRRARGREE